MIEQVNTKSKLLTLKKVAERCGVDPTTVRRWIQQGALEAVILPAPDGAKRRSYRVSEDTLVARLQPTIITGAAVAVAH